MDRQLPTRTSGAATTRASGPARNQQQAVDIQLEGGSAPATHAGKVLAAIQPHCDDIPIFAGGTVSKLVAEGYSGVLIRTTNDEMAGAGRTPGEVILNNERDNYEVARRLGLHKVYDLGYRNHLLDGVSRTEMRARLIFLFRLLKVDTVVSYDPWAHYDENPDHVVTAEVVEAACWMAGSPLDYPEHFDAGLEPHAVTEKYYYARGPQLVNRVVDISGHVEQKVAANLANVTQGPAGNAGARLRARLLKEGRDASFLGDTDEDADRAFIRQFLLADDRELGRQFGVDYAEAFHHIRSGDDPVERFLEREGI